MPERILLVQLADIGDLILTTPALSALREARPDAHLTLLTASHAAPVLDPALVDEIITIDRKRFNNSLSLLLPRNWSIFRQLRDHGYDTIVFFHHFTLRLGSFKFWALARASGASRVLGLSNPHSWFLTDSIPDEGFGVVHQAQYWLNLVALLGGDPAPRRAQVAFDDGVLPLAMHRGRRIVIHAGGGAYNLARRWSPQKFALVADTLHTEFDAQIVLIGTPDDDAARVQASMRHTPVNLTGRTTLTQLADLIRSADLYIGSDSGILHLAAAVRTPVVTIFGPSNHEAWGPWSPGGQVVVVRSAPECSPCSYVGHGLGLKDGCPARTCMHTVSAEQVLESARALLRDETPPAYQGFPYDARQQRDWDDRLQILGLPVDRITYNEWMNLIDRWVRRSNRPHHVCTTNPEFIMIAQQDSNFASILRRADLCVPDGVGLLWAARALNSWIPERVTGSDGTLRIAREAAERGWKLFLLGAAPGVADAAALILKRDYPLLHIAGTYAGSPAPEEEDAIVEIVNRSGADILLVAYGAPQQDKWIARNLPRLRVRMAMGIGGALDFIVGVVPRAPQWMRDHGLEWAYRLYKQPWRFGRMLRLPRFVVAVLLRGSN